MASDIGRPLVVHVPQVQADAGQDLELVLSTTELAEIEQLELVYRRIGTQSWSSLAFQRAENGDFVARVPGREVAAPGVEYYIESTAGLAKGERFASAASPHQVWVQGGYGDTLARRELERADGQRTRVRVRYDYAGFGALGDAPDYYHQGQADVTYRLLRGVRTLRLGGSWMRGETWRRTAAGQVVAQDAVGLDHGFVEVGFGPHDLVGFGGQLLLGASDQGFQTGGGGFVRLGLEPGAHVRLYGAYMNDVGWNAGMVLAWDTVPVVDLQAGVEVSTWPEDQTPAIRGWAQLGVPVGDHLQIDLRGGYQARRFDLGGPRIGGGLSWSW